MELTEELKMLNRKASIDKIKRIILIAEIALVSMLGIIGLATCILFMLSINDNLNALIPAVLTILASLAAILLAVILYRVASKYLKHAKYQLEKINSYSETILFKDYSVDGAYIASTIPSSLKYLAILSIVIEAIFFIYRLIAIVLDAGYSYSLVDILNICKDVLGFIGIIFISMGGFIFFRGKENDELRLNVIANILISKNNIGIEDNKRPKHNMVILLIAIGIAIRGIGMLMPFIELNGINYLMQIEAISDLCFFILIAAIGIYLLISYVWLDRLVGNIIYRLSNIINELPESLYLDISHNEDLVS